MLDKIEIYKSIVRTKYKNLDVIPATINLAGMDIELLNRSARDQNFIKTSQLKRHILNLNVHYDYIINDYHTSSM